jgi:hypothetical protein
MVRTVFRRAAPFVAMLCLAGCEIFTVTPFPAFTSMTDVSVDLAGRIDTIAAGQTHLTYDLTVVDDPSFEPRVLLLVEPPSSDPDVGFNYTGQLIFMDKDLNVVGQAATPTSLDYFSKPYSYAPDGTILAGYTVLTPNGKSTTTPSPDGLLNPPPGLEGFSFTDGSDTYIFSTPAGQYASFDLQFAILLPTTWGYSLTPNGTSLAIIPQDARPATTDPNYTNLGYQLVGLAYDNSTTDVTFVLSEPAQGRIMTVRLDLITATSGTGVLLPSATKWPVSADAWPLAVTVDRPELHADSGGFFMVQRDGWLTRYNWALTGDPKLSGSPLQIVGDRSLSRHYAFLTSDTAGQYMYRFDPASRVLTRYKRWW